jgi:SpoIID/LytB domain protein
VCAAFACLWLWPSLVRDARRPTAVPPPPAGEVDERLQSAAERALGGRSGTVLVMDARTGRLRASIGTGPAFEQAFAPGSALKPFTLLAALRSGAVEAASRASCSGLYERSGMRYACVHPRFKTPLAAPAALSHSCNTFFARAAESLDGGGFTDTLAEFGFGRATGGAQVPEQAGALPRGRAGVAEALGEGELMVTPAQLVSAYAALFNGGRLLAPRRAAAAGFTSSERARLSIEEEHRALLVEGLRAAVVEGTAARARLDEVPLYVFGKTGTSTERGGYRTQGWFVGLAAEAATKESSAKGAGAGAHDDAGTTASPERVSLVVLVLLRRGRGADAAAVSKPIFEEYARSLVSRGGPDSTAVDERAPLVNRAAVVNGAADSDKSEAAGDEREATGDADGEAAPGDGSGAGDAGSVVRVRLTRARTTLSLDRDDYVFGVLAAEGSVETEPEALKALAVAARTYATKNAGRHAAHGFDLCDTTHCQRYAAVTDESARPEFYELARRAVRETAGELLRDSTGRVAESYFSASCGGATADIASLWGERRPPSHLRGGRDEACRAGNADDWIDVISSTDLLRALRSDERSDVGARLDAVRVARRDASGRAELVTLEGERRRLLRGWDFKIIVGRTLGWNVLKSSRFEVGRAGTSYVFRGRGFGHGLGLCQSGARSLASRGATYRQILARYLPGTSARRAGSVARRAGTSAGSVAAEPTNAEVRVDERRAGALFRDVLLGSAPAHGAGAFIPAKGAGAAQSRLTLAGEHFRLSYPARVRRAEAEALLRALEAARADILRRLAGASLEAGALGRIEVVLHETTGDFAGATGEPAWVAAVTRGRRVELQPLDVLRRRGVLATTIRHELVHVACEALARGRRAPLWLIEGLAAHVAGEGPLLARHAPKKRLSTGEIERGLASAGSAEEARTLYAAAYSEVAALVRRDGEAAVWRRAVGGS